MASFNFNTTPAANAPQFGSVKPAGGAFPATPFGGGAMMQPSMGAVSTGLFSNPSQSSFPSLSSSTPSSSTSLFSVTNPSTNATPFGANPFGGTPAASNPSFFGASSASSVAPSPFGGGSTLSSATANVGATPGLNILSTPFNTSNTSLPPFGANSSSTKPFYGINNNTSNHNTSFSGSTFGAGVQLPAPLQELDSIITSYDAKNIYCRFKHMFYNVVPKEDISQYTKPADADDILWGQAVLNNPDPSSLVPVQATGLEDIKRRRQLQREQLEVFQKAIERIEANIAASEQHLKMKTLLQLEECKRKQLEYGAKILRLIKSLEVIRKSGLPLSFEEENLRLGFENMKKELYMPTQFKGRVNDLLSQVRMHTSGLPSSTHNHSEGYQVVDQDALLKMNAFLSNQNTGIAHLLDLLKNDSADVDIILGELQAQKPQ